MATTRVAEQLALPFTRLRSSASAATDAREPGITSDPLEPDLRAPLDVPLVPRRTGHARARAPRAARESKAADRPLPGRRRRGEVKDGLDRVAVLFNNGVEIGRVAWDRCLATPLSGQSRGCGGRGVAAAHEALQTRDVEPVALEVLQSKVGGEERAELGDEGRRVGGEGRGDNDARAIDDVCAGSGLRGCFGGGGSEADEEVAVGWVAVEAGQRSEGDGGRSWVRLARRAGRDEGFFDLSAVP